MKLILYCFFFLSISMFAIENLDQQDMDNLLMFEVMVEKKAGGLDFEKEILLLKKQFEDSSLVHIANGILAYKCGDNTSGDKAFSKVTSNDPLFGLMNDKWYEYAVSFRGDINPKTYDILAINRYETHLRDSVEYLEDGCCLGLEWHYQTLIKDDEKKLKEFELWRLSLAAKFDKKSSGNWYLPYGRLADRGAHKLSTACDIVEAKLLGMPTETQNFNYYWQKIRNLRLDQDRHYTFQLGVFSMDILFEETRAHVLIGNNNQALRMLNELYSYIEKISDPYEYNLNMSHFYYLRGLHFYLQGENKYMLGHNAFELITGRTGAAVQLYLSGFKYGKTKWSLKAKSLYQIIQQETLERYDRKMKNYPEFGSGVVKTQPEK